MLYRDPQIRSYAGQPPMFGNVKAKVLPGEYRAGAYIRFRWPLPLDPDVDMIRRTFPEGGRRLYVLRDPYDDAIKYLVEAYYPDEVRPNFYSGIMSEVQQAAHGFGEMTLGGNDLAPGSSPLAWRGRLPRPRLYSVLEGHRKIHRRTRSSEVTAWRVQEIYDRFEEKKRTPEVDEFCDAYVDAYLESQKLWKPKSHLSEAYSPGQYERIF